MKKRAKVLRKPCSTPVWETPNRPPNRTCKIPAFFGDQFIDKDRGLRTHSSFTEKEGGLEAFLYLETQNFKLG